MSLYAFLQAIQQTPLDIPIRSYVIESEAIQDYLSFFRNEFRCKTSLQNKHVFS